MFQPEHEELKDLVKKMMNVNPKRRISCQEALKHDFFNQEFKDFLD